MRFEEDGVLYEIYFAKSGAVVKVKDKHKYWLKWIINLDEGYIIEYFGKDVIFGKEKIFYGKKLKLTQKEIDEIELLIFSIKISEDREKVKELISKLNSIFKQFDKRKTEKELIESGKISRV